MLSALLRRIAAETIQRGRSVAEAGEENAYSAPPAGWWQKQRYAKSARSAESAERVM